MDVTLLKANILLAIMDMKPVNTDMLVEYLENGCRVIDEANRETELFLMLVEIFAKNTGNDYDKNSICRYVKPMLTGVAVQFGIDFSDDEYNMMADYVAVYRRKIFRSDDIIRDDPAAQEYIGFSKMLDKYMDKNQVMFYVIYRMNSELLANAMMDLRENKEFAYECAERMNKGTEYYNSIVFDGKE